MPLSTSFANQVTDLPSQLDTNFGQVGAMMVTTCTATGNNAISLTPLGGQPPVTSYQNYQQFSFVAAADSTSVVSVQVASLAFQPLYLHDSTTQAASGNIKGDVLYTISYNTALNGGLGGFQLQSQLPVSRLLDVAGSSSQGALFVRGASSWGSLATGGTGNLLQSLGNTLAWSGTKKFQKLIFSTPGAFNFSAASGMTTATVVRILLVGGGGGGGGGNSSNTLFSGAGGGGAGAIAIGFISGLTANTLYSGLIGRGGFAGAGGKDNGNAGSGGGMTTISFGGVQFTAGGGGPGGGARANSSTGGSGGVATNATILINGSNGGSPGVISVANSQNIAGAGGRGWIGGSTAIFGGLVQGVVGGSPGAGGSGGASASDGSTTGLTGNSGNPGIFIMEWMQ